MSEAVQQEPRVLPYVMAINEGVRKVLKEQDNSFVAGEDVAGAGGVYGYYTGLLNDFGPERIYDTPISEKGIMGLGVGASATGCRPIIDLMFMDFIGECMDEIANQMAKMRFMFGVVERNCGHCAHYGWCGSESCGSALAESGSMVVSAGDQSLLSFRRL